MDKKYQIFVSSTYEDLKEERDQAIKAILEMGHIPVGMEMFSAADDEQWQLIARQIEATDYYIVIIAHRYGSETETGLSYTEKEYDYAKEMGIPTLGFIIDDKASWPSDQVDKSDDKKKKIDKFKSKVMAKPVHFWQGKDDLHGKISISLMKAMNTNPRVGWTRTDATVGANVTKELTRLSIENSELRKENQLLLNRQKEAVDEVKETVYILNNNSREFRIRKTASFDDAEKYRRTLLEMFAIIAPYLINELSSKEFSKRLASNMMQSAEYFNSYPIGANKISELIADYVALDLVEPSKKKHPVSDENLYWSLTNLGKQVLKRSRRIQLEEGINTSAED